MQVIKDHVLHRGVIFLHLPQDHISFLLDLGVFQTAVLHNVCQEFHNWTRKVVLAGHRATHPNPDIWEAKVGLPSVQGRPGYTVNAKPTWAT